MICDVIDVGLERLLALIIRVSDSTRGLDGANIPGGDCAKLRWKVRIRSNVIYVRNKVRLAAEEERSEAVKSDFGDLFLFGRSCVVGR